MRVQDNYRKWWIWAVLPAVLVTAGPARAFYWDGWPGSRVAPKPCLLPAADIGNPVAAPPYPRANPTYPPDGHFPKPTPGGPGTPPEPEHAPEPGTGLVGLIGLGAVAAFRRARRRRSG